MAEEEGRIWTTQNETTNDGNISSKLFLCNFNSHQSLMQEEK